MANDRVYVRCTRCRAHQMLLKYYPLGASYIPDETPAKVEAFMREHLATCRGDGQDLGADPGFDLATEAMISG